MPTLNELMLARAEGFLRKKRYRFAVMDKWDQARPMFEEHPHMIRSRLTTFGDTALHGSRFVQGLVSLHLTTPEDLEIQNSNASTAFCLAAMLGYSGLLESMMGKNHNLPLISGHNGMLPVHMAASFGHHSTVDALSVENLLERMELKQIELLFFMTISSRIYDVAINLFEKYPALAIARDEQEQLSALHSGNN